jgi:hypothetical protein
MHQALPGCEHSGQFDAKGQPRYKHAHAVCKLLHAVQSSWLSAVFVMQRELLPVADLPVAKCSVARYSYGGALLAAVGRTNAIVVYPAYYGSGAGASGTTAPVGGSSSHYTQRSSAGDSGRGSGGYSSAAAAAAASGIGTDGACVMRPLFVLKAHVSTVTDLAFSGDDKRLISSGAGGAVYFWDMSTGARLMELEYVDKQCVFYTGGPARPAT